MLITGFKTSLAVVVTVIFFTTAYIVQAYEELIIGIDVGENSTTVLVNYVEDDGEGQETFEFDTTDIEEVYGLLADELDLEFSEVGSNVFDEEDNFNSGGHGHSDPDVEDTIEDAEDYINSLSGIDTEQFLEWLKAAEEAIDVKQEGLDTEEIVDALEEETDDDDEDEKRELQLELIEILGVLVELLQQKLQIE